MSALPNKFALQKTIKIQGQHQFITMLEEMCDHEKQQDPDAITLVELDDYIKENVKKGFIDVSFCKEAYEKLAKREEHRFVPFAVVIWGVYWAFAQRASFSTDRLDWSAYFDKCFGVLKILAKHNFNPNVFTPTEHAIPPSTNTAAAVTVASASAVANTHFDNKVAIIGPSAEHCRDWRSYFITFVARFTGDTWCGPLDKFINNTLTLLIQAGLDCGIPMYVPPIWEEEEKQGTLTLIESLCASNRPDFYFCAPDNKEITETITRALQARQQTGHTILNAFNTAMMKEKAEKANSATASAATTVTTAASVTTATNAAFAAASAVATAAPKL